MDSSYTSSNPVPKKPMGKTRTFDEASRTWHTVKSAQDEQFVFEAYRDMVSSLLEQADEILGTYGIISTIDGEMRIRLRGTEDLDRSTSDRRYVKRGKNIRSIRKEQLLEILHHIDNTIKPVQSVEPEMPINEIVGFIDGSIVDAGLYIIL